ncbi:MAG TPA: hypothetical protein VML55_06375 [Planctomycetaceae bacterium]|nr:hypothetical protein [Planctomycetaceae bacterium]
MSCSPVAVQVGQSAECEIASRYSMFGAHKVLVSGEGVTGEVTTPMEEKDGKRPDLTKIKVRFTVAADALPGVRSFRIATPQGVSTLGQLVVVRDPVIAETGNNNTPDQAQSIPVPATVCGAIERAEDVDCFKFNVEAGRALCFHVRAMRLQDRIHDLQQHVDPIIAIRNASGSTLATSDNTFAADPFLCHRFEQAGEYVLEIRDVRYQGNQFWQYSIEISDRPFVTTVHPLGVSAGADAALELVGANLPADRTATLAVPANLPPGPRPMTLPLGDGGDSNPVEVIVTDLPLVLEADGENGSPAAAQSIAIPAGVSGRIGSEADIDCFAFEAKKGERFTFEVLARRHGSALDSILRILAADGRQLAENDDLRIDKRTDPDRGLENWTAPADGKYVLEVRDLHLRGGDDFVYFLKCTRAEPHFELFADTDKTQLTPGTSGVVFVNANRKNGFEGEIALAIDGLPAGVTAVSGSIPTGRRDGCIILTAAPDAALDVSNVTITGTATHTAAGSSAVELRAVAQPYQETYLPGGGRGHWPVEAHAVSVGAPSDIRAVRLSTHEVTLKPGESQRIGVTIERAPGFSQNVQLDLLFRHLNSTYADTLPPGVTIDAKNSQTLLTGAQTEGQITLTAAANAAAAGKQQVSVMANVSLNFVMKATYSAEPLFVTVAK